MKLGFFRTSARLPGVRVQSLIALSLSVFTAVGCQTAKSEDLTEKSKAQEVAPPQATTPDTEKAPDAASKKVKVEALPFKLEELTTSCGRICDTTKALACERHAECQNGCIQAFGTPVCVAELRQFLSCTENSPATSFECSPEGIPVLKDGVCDSEQGAVMSCFTKATH